MIQRLRKIFGWLDLRMAYRGIQLCKALPQCMYDALEHEQIGGDPENADRRTAKCADQACGLAGTRSDDRLRTVLLSIGKRLGTLGRIAFPGVPRALQIHLQ